MPNEIKKDVAVAAPKSNGGLLDVLNLAAETVEYKTRQQIADDIVALRNGEIVDFASLKETVVTKDETVKYKKDNDEIVEYTRTNIEMPAGALKLVSDPSDNENYLVDRAQSPFIASASYSSKMHTVGSTKVLCEIVAPGKFSMMSDKYNDNEYYIVVYHIL